MKNKFFYTKKIYFLFLFFSINVATVIKKVNSDTPNSKKMSLNSLREHYVDLLIDLVCLIQKVMTQELNKKECNKQKMTDVLDVFEWTTAQISVFKLDPTCYSRTDLELNTEKAEKNLLYLQNINLSKEGEIR